MSTLQTKIWNILTSVTVSKDPYQSPYLYLHLYLERKPKGIDKTKFCNDIVWTCPDSVFTFLLESSFGSNVFRVTAFSRNHYDHYNCVWTRLFFSLFGSWCWKKKEELCVVLVEFCLKGKLTKIEIPSLSYSSLFRQRLWWFFSNPHGPSGVSLGEWNSILIQWKPTVTTDSNRKNNGGKTWNASILLVWCHHGVRKTRQSNLTRNGNVNTEFLAKTSTVASKEPCSC